MTDLPKTDAGVFISGFSPWGTPDNIERIAPGIWLVETPSHGGYFVEPEQRKAIPQSWQRASFTGQGAHGWYEEDCDWCMVALAFPHLFSQANRDAAWRTFRNWLEPNGLTPHPVNDMGCVSA